MGKKKSQREVEIDYHLLDLSVVRVSGIFSSSLLNLVITRETAMRWTMAIDTREGNCE